MGRPEAAVSPQPYPQLLLPPQGLIPVMEKSLVPSGSVPAGKTWCPGQTASHQPQRAGKTHQKGNDLKLGTRENGYQKALK